MCGIAGFYTTSSITEDEKKSIINSMLNTISHRGPDDRGTFIHKNLCLGHVRLSIIDIQYGNQPVISNDGRYILIFNGEIYNYLELRQQLISKGYKFKTYSDSEVLLYMYIEYNNKALDYLNGMFSFVIYDKINDTLFIARDHFGIKPFYYTYDNSNFIFASEIKAILKYPGIDAECDYLSLQEYINFQFVLKKHTLFKNILSLEPATYIVLKKGVILEKKEYWKPIYNINSNKSIDQFASEILILLDNSLSIQMRSDVPIGVYLSGGLDSSTVATLAARYHFGELPTFTGAFKESIDYDETRYAKLITDTINGKNYTIYPTANDFSSNFEKIIYYMDEPAAGPGIFPQFIVSSFASKYVKVVLGGQGGDEIFGGYARYMIAYLEECLRGAIFETYNEDEYVVTLKSIIENLPLLKNYIPLIKQQFSSGLFDEMPSRYFKLINRSQNATMIYSNSFISTFDLNHIYDKFLQIFNNPETKSLFNKMTYFDMKTLLPALLHVEDRVSMASSIESRVPLLDKRIVELVATIPPTMKFAGGKTKHMLIQSVKNILPKEIINRKDKMGFPTPINEWFSFNLREYILDIFNSQKTRERGIFNVKNIEKIINEKSKFARDIWGALNIELWFRIFIDKN